MLPPFAENLVSAKQTTWRHVLKDIFHYHYNQDIIPLPYMRQQS